MLQRKNYILMTKIARKHCKRSLICLLFALWALVWQSCSTALLPQQRCVEALVRSTPQQLHMLGFVLWPCLQLQGMGPGVTEIFGLMGEKLTVSGLDVEEHRHGSDPQQAEAAEKAALRLSWMRRAVVAALAGVAFLWAEFRGDLVVQWAANWSSLWLSLHGSHLSCSLTSVLVKNTSSLLVLSKHSYCFSFVVYSNPVRYIYECILS